MLRNINFYNLFWNPGSAPTASTPKPLQMPASTPQPLQMQASMPKAPVSAIQCLQSLASTTQPLQTMTSKTRAPQAPGSSSPVPSSLALTSLVPLSQACSSPVSTSSSLLVCVYSPFVSLIVPRCLSSFKLVPSVYMPPLSSRLHCVLVLPTLLLPRLCQELHLFE